MDERRLLNVLQSAKRQGFEDIGLFLNAFLTTDDSKIHKLADNFIRNWCLPITTIMLRRSKWGSSKRQTTNGTKDLSSILGHQLVTLILPILGNELSQLIAAPFARLSPSELKARHIKQFSFRRFEKLFDQRAPLLWHMIRSLCKASQEEHAGNHAYLGVGKPSTTNRGCSNKQDTTIGLGWDENDNWVDQGQWQFSDSAESSGGDTSHRTLRSGEKTQVRRREVPGIVQRARRYRDQPQMNQENLKDDLFTPATNSASHMATQKTARSRRIRNRAMIATTVLAQIMFAQSQQANTFQSIMAAYNFSTQTSKRTCAVLNQLGVTVSPVTFTQALKHNAHEAAVDLKKKVLKGNKIGFFYDNLVIYDRKAEESLINKNQSLQLTACAGYYLNLPTDTAENINATVDPELAIRPTPNLSERVLIPLKRSDLLLEAQAENAIERTISPVACCDSTDAESDYVDLTDSSSDGRRATRTPGIDMGKLFRKNPNYLSLRPLDVICSESLQGFYVSTVKAHLCAVLSRHCGHALKENPNCSTIRPYEMETLYQVPIEPSEIFTLPTLDLDESTIDGNAAVLEELIREIGLPLEDILGTAIAVSGDQMTLSRIRSVQELRIRDEPEHRASYVSPWMGFLHYGFAAVDVVKRCNRGQYGGGDPGSIETLVQLLGRTGILDARPNFNATHRLIEEMCDSYILSAFMEITRTQSLSALNRVLAESKNWVSFVDEVYDEYYPLGKVDFLRSRAKESAMAKYTSRIQEIRSLPSAQRTQAQQDLLKARGRETYIAAHADRERDLLYENALLFMQQSILYRDYFTAMRKGDAGRLEKSMEFFLVLFEGAGKSNYARELMEQQVDRKAVWKPFMREIWRRNCLLNLSGVPNKFLAVDEVCEHLVRQLKSSYNPRNSWQSKEFHMKTLSRLIMFLCDVRSAVATSSGAPSYGTRHSKVASDKDIETIIRHLNENKLLFYPGGRIRISDMHNARRAQESLDAWAIGTVQHWTGVPLAAVVRRRIDQQLASKVYHLHVPPAYHNLEHDRIERDDAFDAGSVLGPGDGSDDSYEVGDSEASNCDSNSSDSGSEMGEDGIRR